MFLLIIIFININSFSICYIFSVIISIYNTGRYLDDTITSLINQTIGFNNIQLILVNDGSKDDSENICLKYKKIYPNNIIYLRINHQGVSQGRNVGLKYAQGKYINFLDSDDKWDSKSFELFDLYFNIYTNVDIISGRMKYFESKNNFHFLDYKYKNTRVVNLTEEFNCIQLSCSSCFFRKSSIEDQSFEEGILFGEDVRFLSNIFLKKPLLCVVKEAIYYYRKRADSTSAIQSTEENKYYYFSTLINVHQYLIDRSIKLYNIILPFIQYFIGYDIIFRIKSKKAYEFLDLDSYKRYCKLIENLLYQIEDKYILEQKIFPSRLLIFALSKKYNRDLRYDIISKNNSFIYSNYIMLNLNRYKSIINWKIMEIKGNHLHLEGEDKFWMPREKFYYFCKLGNKIFFPTYYHYSGYDFITIYGIITKGRIISFDIIININDQQNLSFFLSYNNINIEIFTSYDIFTHIPPLKNSYYVTENYIFKNEIKNLIIIPYNKNLTNTFEKEYCIELKKIKKYNLINFRKQLSDWELKNNHKNYQIWLINDRKNKAGDNGEYFFRYLLKIKPNRLKFYFAIKKNCPDYYRLKKCGNIINFDSTKYFNIFLRANKIISSVSDSWAYNPFEEDGKYMSDLYDFDFIYLQNGIIKDDLSQYLNKIINNFQMLITSSKREYKSLLNAKYGYKNKNIVLTGLSRFDNLENQKNFIKKEKIILILPTWRNYIKGTLNLITHESIFSESFRNTDYFNFYNKLINNNKFLNIINESNYIGISHVNLILLNNY